MDHEGHDIFPHRHFIKEKGRCSGRFWCVTCDTWLDGKKCL